MNESKVDVHVIGGPRCGDRFWIPADQVFITLLGYHVPIHVTRNGRRRALWEKRYSPDEEP